MGKLWRLFRNPKARLFDAVRAFSSWADKYPRNERSAEWETDYDQWSEIITAFARFLDAGNSENWDAETTDLLLYILARDNEMGELQEQLISKPAHLITLAMAGLRSREPNARWQLADALGYVALGTDEVESLLEQFFQNEDEYVSRRALLALGRIHSSKVEPLAIRAWDTGDEYQRMAALAVLSSHDSSLLPFYLDLAKRDGREYLVNLAVEILGEKQMKIQD